MIIIPASRTGDGAYNFSKNSLQCRTAKERYMSDAEATAKFAIRSVLIVDCEGLQVGNLDAIEQTVDRLLAAITSDAMWWSFEQLRPGK